MEIQILPETYTMWLGLRCVEQRPPCPRTVMALSFPGVGVRHGLSGSSCFGVWQAGGLKRKGEVAECGVVPAVVWEGWLCGL